MLFILLFLTKRHLCAPYHLCWEGYRVVCLSLVLIKYKVDRYLLGKALSFSFNNLSASIRLCDKIQECQYGHRFLTPAFSCKLKVISYSQLNKIIGMKNFQIFWPNPAHWELWLLICAEQIVTNHDVTISLQLLEFSEVHIMWWVVIPTHNHQVSEVAVFNQLICWGTRQGSWLVIHCHILKMLQLRMGRRERGGEEGNKTESGVTKQDGW